MKAFLRLAWLASLIWLLSYGGLRAALWWADATALEKAHPLTIGACQLPCWQGVQPGQSHSSTFWAQLDRVRAAGWAISGSPSTDENERLIAFSLTLPPAQMRLGELILLYGPPDYVQAWRAASLGGSQGRREVRVDFYLYWAEGYVQVRAVQLGRSTVITPQVWVTEILMRGPVGESIVPLGSPQWHGFGKIKLMN